MTGPSISRPAIELRIRALIERQLPMVDRTRLLEPDLALGPEGAGLDSVGIAELLVACEQAFGLSLSVDLVDGEELTIRALADAVERAARHRGAV